MFEASLQGWRPFTRTLTYATPLILTGLAAAVAFRMKVYNIGAEGQLFAGAIAASGLALALPDGLPRLVMLTAVVARRRRSPARCGRSSPRSRRRVFGTDEIITTLMLNFVALGLMNYLIQGSMSFWRNPTHPVPQGKEIPGVGAAARACSSGCTPASSSPSPPRSCSGWRCARRHGASGCRSIGDSPRAARYAGIGVGGDDDRRDGRVGSARRASAGAIEVSAVTKGLEPKALAIELGYTGIIIAAVARLNALGVVPVAVFLAAITVSGSSLQAIGVPVEVVVLLQGLIFLSVTAGEFFVTNRIRLAHRASAPQTATGASTARPTAPPADALAPAWMSTRGSAMNDTVLVLSAASAIVAGTPILLAALGRDHRRAVRA